MNFPVHEIQTRFYVTLSVGKECLGCIWTFLSICFETYETQNGGGGFGGGPILLGGGDFMPGTPDEDDAEDCDCPG